MTSIIYARDFEQNYIATETLMKMQKDPKYYAFPTRGNGKKKAKVPEKPKPKEKSWEHH